MGIKGVRLQSIFQFMGLFLVGGAVSAIVNKFLLIPWLAASSAVLDDQCYSSGAVDLSDKQVSESISDEFLFLALMENGKRATLIGRAIYDSNVKHQVTRCYTKNADDPAGYYIPAKNRLIINLHNKNEGKVREAFNRGAFSEAGFDFPVGDLEYEESMHAYQYTEFDIDSLRERVSLYHRYLVDQAIESQAKVLKRVALGSEYSWHEVLHKIGYGAVDYVSRRYGGPVSISLILQNFFLYEEGGATTSCMTSSFSSFFSYHSAAYMYTDGYDSLKYGVVGDGARPLDVEAFNSIFGHIPGSAVNYLNDSGFDYTMFHDVVQEIVDILQCVSDKDDPKSLNECSPESRVPQWNQSRGYRSPAFVRVP